MHSIKSEKNMDVFLETIYLTQNFLFKILFLSNNVIPINKLS